MESKFITKSGATSGTDTELINRSEKVFLRELSFLNYNECYVSINESEFFQLKERQGFETDKDKGHPLIYSFVIKESNIEYQFVGLT